MFWTNENKEDYVLKYCKQIYGLRILYCNKSLYAKTTKEIYRIEFKGNRDRMYKFYNMTNNLILTENCLARAFFLLASHDIYEEIGKVPSETDWEKFLKDAHKYFIGG